MGGAVQLQLLARSEHADAVAGLVLDAPVMDWRDTLEQQGDLAGLPPWLTALALRFVELRGGVDLDELDWTARDDLAEVVDVPVYLVHSDDDAFVPNGPSRAGRGRAGRPGHRRASRAPASTPASGTSTREGYEDDMRAWFVGALATALAADAARDDSGQPGHAPCIFPGIRSRRRALFVTSATSVDPDGEDS